MIEPMVLQGLPRKDSINSLSKKQNLGIITFYKGGCSISSKIDYFFNIVTTKIKLY